jgi:hypothetical protein
MTDIAFEKLMQQFLTNGDILNYLQPNIVLQYTGKNVRRRSGKLKVGGASLSHFGNTYREDMDYRIDPSKLYSYRTLLRPAGTANHIL